MPFSTLKKAVLEFIATFYPKPPASQVTQHRGKLPLPGGALRFSRILLVDDMARYTDEAQAALAYHYTHGEVTIHAAHTFQAALSLFKRLEFDLVVMDFDLQDNQGSGQDLTKEFLLYRPNALILANSNNKAYNKLLLDQGAIHAVNKSQDQLVDWLAKNDPMP